MANYNMFASAVGAIGTYKTNENNYVVVLRSAETVAGLSVTKVFPVIMNFDGKITAKFPKDFSEDEMSRYTEYLQVGMKDSSYPSIGYTRGIIYPEAADLDYEKDYPLGEFIPRVMSPGVDDMDEKFYAKEVQQYYGKSSVIAARVRRDFTTSYAYKPFADDASLVLPYLEQKDYILDDWAKSIEEGMLYGDRFFVLQGPPGTGKTDAIVGICARYGIPFRKITGNITDTSKIIGRRELVPSGESSNKTVFVKGSLLECYKYGGVFIVDEANYLPQQISVVLNEMTDGTASVVEQDTGAILERHPNFMVVYTFNPGARGAIKMVESLANRVDICKLIPALTIDKMAERILFSYPNVGKGFAKALAHCVGVMNNYATQIGSTGTCTVRQLKSLCKCLNNNPISLDEFTVAFTDRIANPVLAVNIPNINKASTITESEDYKDLISKIFGKYKFKEVLGTDFEWVLNSGSTVANSNAAEDIVGDDVDSILNGLKGMVK